MGHAPQPLRMSRPAAPAALLQHRGRADIVHSRCERGRRRPRARARRPCPATSCSMWMSGKEATATRAPERGHPCGMPPRTTKLLSPPTLAGPTVVRPMAIRTRASAKKQNESCNNIERWQSACVALAAPRHEAHGSAVLGAGSGGVEACRAVAPRRSPVPPRRRGGALGRR